MKKEIPKKKETGTTKESRGTSRTTRSSGSSGPRSSARSSTRNKISPWKKDSAESSGSDRRSSGPKREFSGSKSYSDKKRTPWKKDSAEGRGSDRRKSFGPKREYSESNRSNDKRQPQPEKIIDQVIVYERRRSLAARPDFAIRSSAYTKKDESSRRVTPEKKYPTERKSAGKKTPDSAVSEYVPSGKEGIRLNKYLASCGVASRRKVEELILEGRVTVNGDTVTTLGEKVEPEKDKIAVDGETIRHSTKKVYILLNKPKGIITSVSDDKNRTTVIDLIKENERIFPVGRLDYDTSGLLLLTNDGELANRLMHPSWEMKKTYLVTLSRPLEEKHRLKITDGVYVEGRRTAECTIRFPRRNDYENLLITLHEGRNRQVRKMFEQYGYFVRELERTEYAGLKCGDLKKGDWRKLSADEVKLLYKHSGLEQAK